MSANEGSAKVEQPGRKGRGCRKQNSFQNRRPGHLPSGFAPPTAQQDGNEKEKEPTTEKYPLDCVHALAPFKYLYNKIADAMLAPCAGSAATNWNAVTPTI